MEDIIQLNVLDFYTHKICFLNLYINFVRVNCSYMLYFSDKETCFVKVIFYYCLIFAIFPPCIFCSLAPCLLLLSFFLPLLFSVTFILSFSLGVSFHSFLCCFFLCNASPFFLLLHVFFQSPFKKKKKYAHREL